jgi:peptidoglycan/LPS O-acetylase OafA/YrhL
MQEPGAPASVHFSSPSGRIPALDGVRGVAILLVMVSHLYGLVWALEGEAPTLGLDVWANRIVHTGWMGVDLFFVLSGFLITGILYDAKHSNTYFRSFYARRFLRIFPLYYGFLILLLVIAPHFDVLRRASNVDALRDAQFWYWTYLSNYQSSVEQISNTQTFQTGFRHFWSLAIEEQFYLIWPSFVLLLDRRKLMVVCVALVVAAFLTRMYLQSDAASSWARLNAPHVFLPARMDTLALGALLALALRDGDLLQRLARFAVPVMAFSAALLAVYFFREKGLSTIDRDTQLYGFTAIALMFAALLSLVVTARPESRLNRFFSNPYLMFFGQYAYGLYVVHLLIGFVLADRMAGRIDLPEIFGSQMPVSLAFALIAMSASIAGAWVSWHLFEKQFLKLKRFFPYEQASPPDAERVATPALHPEPELAARTS